MFNVNYKKSEIFKWKFRRDPKIWTIEQIHDVWLKLVDRSEKRKKDLLDYQNFIISKVPENDKGERIIFFEKDEFIYKYVFKYEDYYKSCFRSTDRLTFSKDPVRGRDEKIEFILNNEKVFEMGEKYRQLDRMLSYLHYNIFDLLWYEVEEFLRKEFKEVKYFKEDVIKISIGNKIYYAQIDPQHRFQYKKFHFRGEEMPIIFKIK